MLWPLAALARGSLVATPWGGHTMPREAPRRCWRRSAVPRARLARCAISGDAANRSRRLRAEGRAKMEEEQRRQEVATLPSSSLRFAEVLDALGVALLAQGRPQEAEEAFRGALRMAQPMEAEWAANNLAVALKAQGSERYGEAEQIYRATLKRRQDSWPSLVERKSGESPEILTSLNNLAVLLKAEGQWSEAEELYRQALQGRRRLLGTSAWRQWCFEVIEERKVLGRIKGNLHPDTLTSINNLATLLSGTGRSEEAEQLYQEALEGCRKTLGLRRFLPSDAETTQDTLFSADNLGALLFREGRPEDAEPYFRRAQQGLSKKLGALDPEALRSEDNLAVTLMALQRLDEAEPLLRNAVEGFRQVLGEEHPDTLVAQANLQALLEEGPFVRAGQHEAEARGRKRPGKCVMKMRSASEDHLASCSISELTASELQQIKEKAAAKAAQAVAAPQEDAEAPDSAPKPENEESDKEAAAEESDQEDEKDDKDEEMEKVCEAAAEAEIHKLKPAEFPPSHRQWALSPLLADFSMLA
eukprot:s1382_g2.t1